MIVVSNCECKSTTKLYSDQIYFVKVLLKWFFEADFKFKTLIKLTLTASNKELVCLSGCKDNTYF